MHSWLQGWYYHCMGSVLARHGGFVDVLEGFKGVAYRVCRNIERTYLRENEPEFVRGILVWPRRRWHQFETAFVRRENVRMWSLTTVVSQIPMTLAAALFR